MNDTLLETPPATPETPTPPSKTPPAPTGFVNPDGTFRENWMDQLPEDLAEGKPTLGKYRSFNELAKAHVSLQSLMGKKANAITVPGEKSTPEEIAAYRKALGVPETPEAYTLKPEQLPEGFTWDDELGKGFAQIAHQHNIPNAAMKALVERHIAGEQARAEVMAQEAKTRFEEGKSELQKEFGGNFDKNIQTATRMAKTLGLDPASAELQHPNIVRALVRMSGMVSEDRLGGIAATPTTASSWKDILTNPENPYHKKYHAGDLETVKYVRDLMSQQTA